MNFEFTLALLVSSNCITRSLFESFESEFVAYFVSLRSHSVTVHQHVSMIPVCLVVIVVGW
jgi:hypothetical protein